ncbi:hypothetical protein NW762_007713 [Fusarium torreyae]|uniref:Uncharacterized protein n=1 Tax=Fusarium torreyae TaxID=1237075 RepID=A0A9W8RXK4_9HYPO|nr:hypothetical protein NW762_007713 [Fusarium torreyae]
MSPGFLVYTRSEPYQRYLNGGIRPIAELPPLDFNKDTKFNSPSAIQAHYREVHKVSLLGRRPGNLNYGEDQQVVQWYTELVNGQMPSWPPANHRALPGNNNDGSAQASGGQQVTDEYPAQLSDVLDYSQSLPSAKASSQVASQNNNGQAHTNNEAMEGEKEASELRAVLNEMI